jgi:hypothetical protein
LEQDPAAQNSQPQIRTHVNKRFQLTVADVKICRIPRFSIVSYSGLPIVSYPHLVDFGFLKFLVLNFEHGQL